jgi:hypothetical protein
MMEDCGNYLEHEERNPVGTTWQQFQSHRWEPNQINEIPTVEGVKQAAAEMEERLAAHGITREVTEAMAAALVLEKFGPAKEEDKS